MPQSSTDPFFLPYQKKWIEDNSRIKIMEKSRQIGLSWTAAYNTVRRQNLNTTKLDAWVSSRDELQAKLFLEDCKSFSKILNLACKESQHNLLSSKHKSSCYSLEFLNTNRIHSLTSNPDAQAGKRGTRILDEFALHPDPKKLYNIAYPGITWGGQLEIISTHRGADNYFNKLIEEAKHNGNPKSISLHKVTLEDALNQGFLEKLQKKLLEEDERKHMSQGDYFDAIKNACSSQEAFLQEYMCTPASDHQAFIEYDLIFKNEYPSNTSWESPDILPQNQNYYLGVDLGRDNDLTVFWLSEKIQDTLFTRKIITLHKTPFEQQKKILFDLLQNQSIRRTCIDQTGLGRQFAEDALSRFGPGRIEGITFTSQVKESLAYPLRNQLERKAFRIPEDPIIRSDFRSIKKEMTSSGNIRFSAQRRKNGHADRFWAAALSIHASKSHHSEHYEKITKIKNYY